MCSAKGYGFYSFWSEKGYQSRPFWSEIGYGLCTLVLNWICFLEELATSSSFGDKIVLIPFNVYANYRVRAVTDGHALRSRAGLQGLRSDIGYQIFDQVWNRVGTESQLLV